MKMSETRFRVFTRPLFSIGRISIEVLSPLLILVVAIHSYIHTGYDRYGSRDLEIYGAIARFWSEGWIPYKDLYDFKPPLIYLTLRLAYNLWGYEAVSLWKTFVVLAASSSLALYAGFRISGYPVAATISGLAMLTLWFADPLGIGWHFQNTEMLVAVFGAFAMACATIYMKQTSPYWVFASGIFL